MRTTPLHFRPAFQLAILSVFCSSALHAQVQFEPNPPEASYTTEHLNAVVLNSVDGKPVARVLVTSPDRRMAAMTDSAGRFSFDYRRSTPAPIASQAPADIRAVSAFQIVFNVRRPGYLADMVLLNLPALQADTPGPILQLKIVPAATLTGHLYPESGDLPANVSVELRHKQVSQGTANWVQFASAQVNSRGEFRIANLQPGDYKLLAPARVAESNPPSTDSVPGFRAAFYPNASSFDAATPIHLNPGETSTANLAYRPTPFYKVTIPVTGLAASAGVYVSLLSDSPGLMLLSNGQSVQGYLPGGDYDLELGSTERPSPATPMPLQSTAFVHIQVSGHSIEMAPVALLPDMELPIVVRREFTSSQPNLDRSSPQLWVNFQSLDLNRNSMPRMSPMMPGKDDSALKIENLTPGNFRVMVSPRYGYVAAVTSGTTNLLQEPLHVLAGDVPRPIEVTLRDDFASVSGRILDNAVPTRNGSPQPIFFMAISLDRPQADPLGYGIAQSNQLGQTQLPPGRYLLLASHRQLLQNVEYHSEDVLRDLLAKGAVVTLSPNQKAEVQIPLMLDSEFASGSNSYAGSAN